MSLAVSRQFVEGKIFACLNVESFEYTCLVKSQAGRSSSLAAQPAGRQRQLQAVYDRADLLAVDDLFELWALLARQPDDGDRTLGLRTISGWGDLVDC